MTLADAIQPSIFFRPGQKPPACFRLLLLNVAAGTEPQAALDALARIFDLVDDLRAGRTADLHGAVPSSAEMLGDVELAVGFGRRLFDVEHHQPALTDQPRPHFVSYLDQRQQAFPAIPWHRGPPGNRGEADLGMQLTGPSDAAVNCTVVEIWKRITDEALPIEPSAMFAGFGRPDGRGWLDFHDGVSNLPAKQRLAAIRCEGDPEWMAGGTYLAFLRFSIDLRRWRELPREQQELLVGRDKQSGRPLGAGPSDAGAFADPPETTSPELDVSHIHRANQTRSSPAAPGALRFFRQGYDFLDGVGPEGPELGLNFVSFQSNPGTLQHVLHLPGWLGDVNFGGPPGSPSFITLADGGFYAVPPRGDPFPGAGLFVKGPS